MAKTRKHQARYGEWRVTFDPATSRLDCRHKRSGATVSGALSFGATIKGAHQAWTVGPARDTVEQRLALLDPRGEVQGYLAFAGKGGALRILSMHRAAQNYPGALAFCGAATLGAQSFACRTTPPATAKVVQMASGPADSAVNDSIFDIATDTVLRFTGQTVSLATPAETDRQRGKPSFEVRLTACPESAHGAAIVLDVEEDFYRSRYVPAYRPVDKKRCPSPPTGWMSWNVYFDQAGEKENLDEARVAAEHLKPFGLEIWSIESWQENSDKLPVSVFHNLNLKAHPGQFPHGMKWLADQIRALGFRPGIWTVPFGTGEEKFYLEHKGWFLHDRDGKPMSNWSGRFLLDPSQPAVRNHMRKMHEVMSKEWGYEFFKIDGMSGRSSGYSAHFYERPDVQAAFQRPCRNPFEMCVEACRKGIGKDRLFLACQGHYSGPEVAHADAARIGGDIVSPNQPSKWHNIISAATATLNQLFVHNIIWYGDPDTLLVGEYHPMDTARIAATIVALPGQMMFAGDKLAELPMERMRLLQQSLPVCDVRPLDLYPIFDLLPVWDLKIRRPFGEWDVVSLLNWGEEAKEIGVEFEELGLPAGETYLVYEFWGDKFLGEKQGGVRAMLPPKSSQLLAIHRVTGVPQFLSTDRHLTQGGTCLKAVSWDGAKGELSGAVELVGGHPAKLVLYLPVGYEFMSARSSKASVVSAATREGRVLDLILSSKKTQTIEWEVSVRSKPGGATQ